MTTSTASINVSQHGICHNDDMPNNEKNKPSFLADSPCRSTLSSSSSTSLVIPEEFICPITQEIMVDPVLSRYGQSYERKAIIEWLASGTHACPLTRQPMSLQYLVTHHRLRMQIEQWCEIQDIELSQLVNKTDTKMHAPDETETDGICGGKDLSRNQYHEDDEEDTFEMNHRAVCAAFLDLPQEMFNGENGSTGHSTDDEEELTEVRIRRVVVADPRRETRTTTTSSQGQEPTRRRSLLSRLTRRNR